MPSELSTDSTKTSTSSDSSTTTSKVHVKPITQLTLSNYFELCSFSVFLDFFHLCSIHSFSPAFFPFLILFYSRSHSIHSFTPFTWVIVLLPAGLAFCFVFYFLFILGPLHVIVFLFLVI